MDKNDNKPINIGDTVSTSQEKKKSDGKYTDAFKKAVKTHEKKQAEKEELAKKLDGVTVDIKALGAEDKDYAYRFLEECGPMSTHPVKYYEGLGWATWDGIKWQTYPTISDSDDAIKAYIYESMDRYKYETLPAALKLYEQKVSLDRGDYQSKLALDVLKSYKPRPQNRNVIQGIIYTAKGRKDIKVPAIEWDRPNPDIPETIYTINTPAGLYDLRTTELYKPTGKVLVPDLLITKCTAVEPSKDYHFDSEGHCIWLEFINSIFPDKDLMFYVQKFLGYCLLGQKNMDLFAILYGTGGNGKTLLTNTISHALGGDYVANLTTKSITSAFSRYGNNSGTKEPPTPSLVKLKGARLGMMSELGEGDVLDAETLKKMTGGGTLTGRDVGGRNISFEPTHQLLLDSNYKPRITNANDNAIWRRIIIIPFVVDFTDGSTKADPELKTKLLQKEVLQDCLLWMIQGAMAVIAAGLPGPNSPDLPQIMQNELKEYKVESDYVGQWIAERCVIGREEAQGAAELYDDYCEWYEENVGGPKPIGKIKFGKTLDGRTLPDYDGKPIKISRYKNTSVKGSPRSYHGIAVKARL